MQDEYWWQMEELPSTDVPTIPFLAELFSIFAVFPPFRMEFVKFCFSIRLT